MEIAGRGDNTLNYLPCQDLQIERLPYTKWPNVQEHWETLSARLSTPSFFLSSGWTEAWIEVYGRMLRPEIIVFRNGSTVVGMCLLVSKARRYGPFTVQVLYINAAGEDEVDDTCIEYNGILALPEYEAAVGTELGKLVVRCKRDELRCEGFRPGLALDVLEKTLLGIRRIDSVRPSRYVDLCAIRDSGKDYLTTLGATTRSHIRQYFKKYMEKGELHIRVPGNVEEALTMLSELESLHQKHWSMRGKLGSFSSEKFRNFHKELIHRMFPMGAIQILQVQAGSSTIGILYNFVYAGKVYHYQSGFNYTDKRLSPGLVTISCAVQYCLDLGLDEFDFLAGDYQYKRVLGVNYRDLVWTVFRRTNLKMRTLDFMREAKRRWVNRRRKET